MSNSSTIPARLTAGMYPGDEGKTTYLSWYAGDDDDNSYYFRGALPQNAIWMIDRTAPLDPPKFQRQWTSNTEVPSGLGNYLNNNFILAYTFSGFAPRGAPAGELYQTLMQNGAGAELQKLELMATKFACGVGGNRIYQLCSIPGTGTPGLENLETPRYSQALSGESVYSLETQPTYALLMNLVAGADGKYTPVRLGV